MHDAARVVPLGESLAVVLRTGVTRLLLIGSILTRGRLPPTWRTL
jgi:hypothetical protein